MDKLGVGVALALAAGTATPSAMVAASAGVRARRIEIMGGAVSFRGSKSHQTDVVHATSPCPAEPRCLDARTKLASQRGSAFALEPLGLGLKLCEPLARLLLRLEASCDISRDGH